MCEKYFFTLAEFKIAEKLKFRNFQFLGFGFEVSDLKFRISDFGISDFKFEVSDMKFEIFMFEI